MKAGLAAHAVLGLERLIFRHILGLQPDPDCWPVPIGINRLAVPQGIDTADALGPVWSLDAEFMRAWHHRRTPIGAHAFRFEQNGEYDCGWRLADVAARFLQEHDRSDGLTMLTIVPPAPVYRRVSVLPWLGRRLAELLRLQYVPDAFDMTRPLPGHPDSVFGVNRDAASRPKITLDELYRMPDETVSQFSNQRVLLTDWRLHAGRTLTTLTRLLQRHNAEVVRFTWLP